MLNINTERQSILEDFPRIYFGINKNAYKGTFQVSVKTPKPICSQCPVTRKQNT